MKDEESLDKKIIGNRTSSKIKKSDISLQQVEEMKRLFSFESFIKLYVNQQNSQRELAAMI